ncbi:16S rRNA (guanine(966)-N(2))-methyltransferase [Mucinivorans hirudinis]|uniref:16S rRNA (Guanine(966)-N(2))-methyltransferase n=1 Tax=Mucinivorans hirudinis TaxID=1433126 RepID=A0A060RBG2_9BACT|nr:16S rRNA (guanine(966)-N(2))-methyltransferase [Mucinivorans hirudinis]
MRIISGKNSKRIITPPSNFKARPTTDFAKENLFNILANHFDFEDVSVLDLFSGTGSISYEFCSRGARRVVSVESNAVHHRFIAEMKHKLGYEQLITLKTNAFVYLKSVHEKFDVIFADPPYELEGIETIPDLVFRADLLAADGWLIVEHSAATDFSSHPRFVQIRRYGSVNFSIFQL